MWFLYFSGCNTMQDCIEIRRATKSNVLTTALFGLLSLFVASQILVWLPKTWALLGILLVSLSLVALLVAYYKYREPTHSFLLSRQTIQYQHNTANGKLIGTTCSALMYRALAKD